MSVTRRRNALAAGFAAIKGGKVIILLLAGVTIILSLLAAAPLGPALKATLAGTLAGDHILTNHPTFAPTDVFDFLREKATAVSGMRAAARWAFVVALLQQILFAGGIVSALGKTVPFAMPDFVTGVRRNAWHNVKCFLIFLLTAGISLGLWLVATRALSKKVFEGTPPGATSTLLFRIAVFLVALLLYAVFSLLHDFARAARRTESAIGAFNAYGHASRLLAGRWSRALGVFLFWLLLGAAALALGISIEWTAPAVSTLAIAFQIILQLAVLTIRPVVRVAAWGSYLALYDRAQPALPSPVPTPLPLEPAPPRPLTLEGQPLI